MPGDLFTDNQKKNLAHGKELCITFWHSFTCKLFIQQTLQILQVVILEDKYCHVLEDCCSALRWWHRDTFHLVISQVQVLDV